MIGHFLLLALFSYFFWHIFAQNLTAQQIMKERHKIYGHNYSQAQRDCINDIIGNRSFRANKNRIIYKINYAVFFHNNSDLETECYFGCVFKWMNIINATNAVDDDNLRMFSDFLTYSCPNKTEDIDDECADLEHKYRDVDYCDMGFHLYVCIDKVLGRKPSKKT